MSKSLPLNEQYSLTFAERLQFDPAGHRAGAGIVGRPARNYETEQSAKLSITDTGTSFSRRPDAVTPPTTNGCARSAPNRNSFGGVNISGSIGETPLGITNKSISAGFKQSW